MPTPRHTAMGYLDRGSLRNGVYLHRGFRHAYRRPLHTRVADTLFGIALLLLFALAAIVAFVLVSGLFIGVIWLLLAVGRAVAFQGGGF